MNLDAAAPRDTAGPKVGSPGDARTLAAGATVTLTGTLAARAISIITQILIARFLGAASFGLYAIGWTLVRVFGGIGSLGLEAGIIYLGAKYQRVNLARLKGAIIAAIAIPLVSGTIVGLILWYAAPILALRVFDKPTVSWVIRGFAFTIPVYALCFVAGGVTRVSQRMQFGVYAAMAQACSALILFCVLYLFGLGLLGAIIATIGGYCVGCLVSVWYVRQLFPVVFSRGIRAQRAGRELLAYSVSIMFAGLAYNSLMFIDRLFVGAFLSAADTGVYQAASQITVLFGIVIGGFHGVFRPMVADIHAQGGTARLTALYRLCTKWTFYACMPIFVVILSMPRDVIAVVYGVAYSAAAKPLIILTLAQVFTVMTAGSHTVLVMTGRQKVFALICFATLPISAALNLMLVPRFGLGGAAAAVATCSVILNTCTVAAVRKYLGIWPVDVRLLKGLLAAGITSCVFLLLGPLRSGVPAVGVLVTGVASVAIFAVALAAMGIDAEERELMVSLGTSLRKAWRRSACYAVGRM